MRVDILDNHVFSGLSSDRIRAYLVSRGWKSVVTPRPDYEILESSVESSRKSRVWLPHNPLFADYSENVGRLVKDVAFAEQRSQLEVLEDLNTVALGDVVRLTGYDRLDRHSTTIPFQDGVDLIERAKRLAAASAMSVETKKAVFPSARSATVSEYLDSVRLGQTEKGSYKIKLISPLPIQVKFPGMQDVPFGRRAVKNLMESLASLKDVASYSLKKGNFRFELFNEAVNKGVSANLCEAVADSRRRTPAREFDVSVTWSTIMPQPHQIFTKVEFGENIIPFIEKAAQEFRERNPEVLTIRGFVIRLEDPTKRSPKKVKKIVLFANIEDKYRSVHVQIKNDQDYQFAIDSHKQGAEITVEGLLQRKGNLFNLADPVFSID